jgi:hypothetical protein
MEQPAQPGGGNHSRVRGRLLLPPLNSFDRLFWTTLRRSWPRWTDVLVLVKPETVVGWHRQGFRLYWRWRSRPRGGRPKITEEIRGLIRCMVEENPDWGPQNPRRTAEARLRRLGTKCGPAW